MVLAVYSIFQCNTSHCREIVCILNVAVNYNVLNRLNVHLGVTFHIIIIIINTQVLFILL